MSIPVFYEPNPIASPFLSEEESIHAHRVLRLKSGDPIFILNGIGQKFEAKIDQSTSKKTTFHLLKEIENSALPAYSIHLWIAPTKQMERMEWMVEKCAEFGIQSIGFFHSRYSERKEIKTHRLEKIVVSALKQSKNLFLPNIYPIISFKELVKQLSNKEHEQKLFAYISNPPSPSLSKSIQQNQAYHILIGPEGDFSTEESAALLASDWTPFSLGKAILRTETAGLAATHAIHLLHEN
ncbi:16S rRNA (uracil(1498)-N(3))-methyltransferase [Cytophagaceae bacterium 50C-KIRBA]|uniref:Ribosomal RNA small subunit methyltransferase E n=1 Tax=Aquirufa beregesia TaxID=2516556 RepID=A0ABX0ET83_9BACT|nr:RsmE family RNA methyltransferase [Aquirufa beregesia]NGZ43253.1 16S rRNA (uracil(1498)-N(3))-methyltransferase [Aquirufa beregesia]